MVHGHATGFGATEFGEDHADGDIVYEGGVEVRVLREGGAEDGREEFFGVGIFKGAPVGAGYGGAEGGEDDNVGWFFG